MVGYGDIHSQCFKDTVTAYQSVRQNGELHIPAFLAALVAYKRHQGEAEDASRQAQEYIALLLSILRSIGRVVGINGGRAQNKQGGIFRNIEVPTAIHG
jgi:hypothetical protein